MSFDAQEARFIRKRQATEGVDEQEEEQQREFGRNLQKALDVYGNKNKKRDIESQVQYFGNMIEPFNMREQEDMGDIDQEGYFVMKRKNQYRDAWLQSIEEQNDMMVADKVKKRIKTQGVGWRGVYDDEKHKDQQIQQVNQEENENDQEDQNEEQNEEENQQQEPQQEGENKLTLEPLQIKQLICQLLPMNKSANAYIKDLKKKPKNDLESKQLHDKILELCNMYIEKTNQYDILTLKKEQLEIQVGDKEEENQSEQIDWDQQQQSEEQNQKQKQQKNVAQQNLQQNNIKNSQNDNQLQIQYDNDDIF